MNTLDELDRAVRTAIATKRLGQPVFVRYLLLGREEAVAIASRLAVAVSNIRDWMGNALRRMQAIGALESGQVSLTLQFKNGGTALVSFARDHGGDPLVAQLVAQAPRVDLMVLGNHGAIYFRPEEWGSGEDLIRQVLPDGDLLDVIERALKTGKPQLVEEKP